MPKYKRTKIVGDAQLLFHVPKASLVDFLLRSSPKELTTAYHTVTRESGEAFKGVLVSLNHPDLIRIILNCPSIDATVIKKLHEEYRYRGQKTLYLNDCEQFSHHQPIDETVLNVAIKKLEKQHQQANKDAGFSNVTLVSVDPIRFGNDELAELSYSYIAPVSRVDPKTAYPDVVDDLRSGFIWLNYTRNWVAVCARDERIAILLTEALREAFAVRIVAVLLPKILQQKVESYDNIRRAALHNPATGTTRRFTNSNMSHADPATLAEIRERDQKEERAASGYNQQLSDGTQFAFGYASQHGRIFISRDLTVSQLRSWGVDKINRIMEAFRDLKAEEPTAVVHGFKEALLRGYSEKQKSGMMHLGKALARCRGAQLTETNLQFDSLAMFEMLGDLVTPKLSVWSEKSEEYLDVQCANCRKRVFQYSPKAITCSDCGTPIDKDHVLTGDDVVVQVPAMAELVQLIPNANTLAPVSKLLDAAGQEPYDPETEYFHVRGMRLHYGKSPDQTSYRFEDIKDYAPLLLKVSANTGVAIRQALGAFREKCDASGVEACANCIVDNKHTKCFLRLFGLFDSDYRPRPHHGQEFGDYDRRVNLNGQQDRQMVVLMKSGNPSGKEIRLRDKELGQDISSQFQGYLNVKSVDVVAVCVPQRLEAEFKAGLIQLARGMNKKVIFIHDAELIKMVYSVMKNRKMKLEEI